MALFKTTQISQTFNNTSLLPYTTQHTQHKQHNPQPKITIFITTTLTHRNQIIIHNQSNNSITELEYRISNIEKSIQPIQQLNNTTTQPMAYILPNFSPTILKSKLSTTTIFLGDSPPLTSSSSSSLKPSASYLFPQTKLETPPASLSKGVQEKKQNHQQDDFYVNLGSAVRTLREDTPLIFAKDLNYEIYRDDITFVDPLNTFTGIDKYKLIFWALRFHGKILFREISLEVLRIWQPSQNVILIRWNLKGVPRVPWEAKGDFQGTSRYKLDRNGKIYEHKVDNLAFNFPQQLRPAASVLDFVTASPASPNPTFLWGPVDVHSSSWVEFYRAVRETLDHEGSSIPQDCFVPCQ